MMISLKIEEEPSILVFKELVDLPNQQKEQSNNNHKYLLNKKIPMLAN